MSEAINDELEMLRLVCRQQSDQIEELNGYADAVEVLRRIGQITGCDHVNSPDERAALVRCVEETVGELTRKHNDLEMQFNALIESCWYRTKAGKVHWVHGKYFGTSVAENTTPEAYLEAERAIRRNAGIMAANNEELPDDADDMISRMCREIETYRQALLPFAASASRPGRLMDFDEGLSGGPLSDNVVLALGVKVAAWRKAIELTSA